MEPPLSPASLDRILQTSLEEDLGAEGDVTSLAVLERGGIGRGGDPQQGGGHRGRHLPPDPPVSSPGSVPLGPGADKRRGPP